VQPPLSENLKGLLIQDGRLLPRRRVLVSAIRARYQAAASHPARISPSRSRLASSPDGMRFSGLRLVEIDPRIDLVLVAAAISDRRLDEAERYFRVACCLSSVSVVVRCRHDYLPYVLSGSREGCSSAGGPVGTRTSGCSSIRNPSSTWRRARVRGGRCGLRACVPMRSMVVSLRRTLRGPLMYAAVPRCTTATARERERGHGRSCATPSTHAGTRQLPR